jgi:arginine decarboxylase-like protein
LYAAIALDQSPDSLLVCGFKDDAFIDLASGTSLGKNVVIVVKS